MERPNRGFAAPARHSDLGAENGAASSPIAVIDSATLCRLPLMEQATEGI